MAEIVAAVATTHTPGLLGWFGNAPEDQQAAALEAFKRMREHLRTARPDVLIIFGNDHLLNWPISNTPEYTVGIGEWHIGPADWYDRWLSREEKYRIPGHPALARHIVNEGARRGLAFSYLREMQFDDSVSVPVCYLDEDAAIPMIPISMNCSVPPIPTPRRAYEVGRTLLEVLRQYRGYGTRCTHRLRRLVPRAGWARVISTSTRSSTVAFSNCSRTATMRSSCRSVRWIVWRKPGPAARPN